MSDGKAPGDAGDVTLGGRRYPTRVDADGTRRFQANGVFPHLRGFDADAAARAVRVGGLDARDWAEFLMALGVGVRELAGMEPFRGLDLVEDAGDPADREGADGLAYTVDGRKLAVENDERILFRGNSVVTALWDRSGADLDTLDASCAGGAFGRADYAAFYAMLGLPLVDMFERPALRDCEVLDEEGKPVVLPVRGFVARHVAVKSDLLPARNAICLDRLGDEVLYGTPLGEAEFGPLHAYMHRRFGFPSGRGDYHKDLSGDWCLSTPDPDLFLIVQPGLGPAFCVFSPYTSLPIPEDRTSREARLPEDRAAAMRDAYRTALIDLLRPVSVDGERFNALGYVDHGTALMDYAPDAGERTFAAEYDRGSVVALPVGMAGSRQWDELVSMMRHLGGGDENAGLARLVAAGREAILADIREGPANVRTLVAAGSVGPWHDTVMNGLRLARPEADAASAVATAFLRLNGTGSEGVAIPEFTEAETEEATRLLSALGINAPMTESWRSYNFWRKLEVEVEAFRDLAEEHGFPDGAIRRLGESSRPEARALPGKLREFGNVALAELVERLLAEEDGDYFVVSVLTAYGAERARNAGAAPSP